MVSIHLSDEEKLVVLLGAFLLVLVALTLSVCLALPHCALNKWLLERREKRRRRRREQHFLAACSQGIIAYNQQQGLQAAESKCAPSHPSLAARNSLGPPPAYEAALRATRLQSLASSSSLCKQQDAWQNHLEDQDEQNQLNLGDYFHAPIETGTKRDTQQVVIPIGCQASSANGTQQAADEATRALKQVAPIQVRLWVKLLEPGELVERARLQLQKSTNEQRDSESSCQQQQQQTESQLNGQVANNSLGRRLSRQLSLPHLLGSLKSSLSSVQEHGLDKEKHKSTADFATTSDNQTFSSLSSSTSSGTAPSYGNCADNSLAPIGCQTNGKSCEPSNSGDKKEETSDESAKRAAQNCNRIRRRRAGGKLMALTSGSAITSRVLHMNVASFSYIRDESLISSKRHSQLNWRHFGGNYPKINTNDFGSSVKQQQESKACQLLIGVCDLENLLSSAQLSERPSVQLAASSSIIVQCEILAPVGGRAAAAKQAARNLLSMRNPLRGVIQSANEGPAHETVDFSRAIQPNASSEQLLVSTRDHSNSNSNSTTAAPNVGMQEDQLKAEVGTNDETAESAATKWTHQPAANGKPIVMFQSVPKRIAHQAYYGDSASQYLGSNNLLFQTASSSASNSMGPNSHSSVDLIQFDSVFVSPVLSKSLIESGAHLRVRIYCQSKYLNDTCLAELKLPLKQLLRRRNRDNLCENNSSNQSSEFILNNLLDNMVAASTGSPLTSLLQQIQAEQEVQEEIIDEELALEQQQQQQQQQQQIQGGLFERWWPKSRAAETETETDTEGGEAAFDQNGDDLMGCTLSGQSAETLLERNYLRSLMLSHWLNYLVAPSYECQLIEEERGKLLLGLTYLPTSNRLIFNALSATIDLDGQNLGLGSAAASSDFVTSPGWPPFSCPATSGSNSKHLVKKLRLQADVSYLLRFFMVANGVVLKRKQTKPSKKLEWAIDEAQRTPITFDLVHVNVEQPTFVVALVLRSSHESCENLNTSHTQPFQQVSSRSRLSQLNGGAHNGASTLQLGPRRSGKDQSDSECATRSSATCRAQSGSLVNGADQVGPNETDRQPKRRDFVIGHLVLAEQMWKELKAQPRKQIVKQFKLM